MREGIVRVSKLWYVHLCPAFHPEALVCVAQTEATEFRGKTHEPWHRGVLVISGGKAPQPIEHCVAELEEDPVWPLLTSVDLTVSTNTVTLDGIGYVVEVPGRAIHATFRFSNPTVEGLRAIESALLQTARSIAQSSDAPAIRDWTNCWCR
jgi:hypothetical protein